MGRATRPEPPRHANKRSILLVCTANICRSPMAEAVLRKQLALGGLDFEVGSAATHPYMLGMPPFPLAVATAKRRGYDITGIVARRVDRDDFARFDVILGMSRGNVESLKAMSPWQYRRKIRLLTDYADEYRRRDIPDPYGGPASSFELALDMIEEACSGVARSLHSLIARPPSGRARAWSGSR